MELLADTNFQISMIAAVARELAIGIDNKMPWHISEDFKFFKDKTIGKPIIMGRKTYESIGRPLPKRLNVILTRNKDSIVETDLVRVATSIEQAIKLSKEWAIQNGVNEIMIGGGQQIYKEALPFADTIYLTEIDAAIPAADTFFPRFNKDVWKKTDEIPAQNEQFKWVWVTYKKS